MQIEVTQKHIREGRERHNKKCAVALALQEATGEKNVQVNYGRARVGLKEVPLPEEVSVFMRGYDTREKMAPFSFELAWS